MTDSTTHTNLTTDADHDIGTATSPEDKKLRLYPLDRLDRLDEDTYREVREAGFRWAPKQELFVAPSWSPEREDLLRVLCGEIEDEDTSLVERAEERAERFDTYRDNRARDGEAARASAAELADAIPLGQPILVGHHSEKRARRDAQRIENGMRRAMKAFETSQYWASRAAGAISSSCTSTSASRVSWSYCYEVDVHGHRRSSKGRLQDRALRLPVRAHRRALRCDRPGAVIRAGPGRVLSARRPGARAARGAVIGVCTVTSPRAARPPPRHVRSFGFRCSASAWCVHSGSYWVLLEGLPTTSLETAAPAARGTVTWLLRSPSAPNHIKDRLLNYLHRPGSSAFPVVVKEVTRLVGDADEIANEDLDWVVTALERLLEGESPGCPAWRPPSRRAWPG